MAVGTIGPRSVDPLCIPLGTNCWKYFAVVPGGDFLSLSFLGRGRAVVGPSNTQNSQGAIIEYVSLQKAAAADVVNVSKVIQPASVGASGVPIGGSIAGEIGAEVASGRYWQGTEVGQPTVEALLIENTGAANCDVTVIVREDL